MTVWRRHWTETAGRIPKAAYTVRVAMLRLGDYRRRKRPVGTAGSGQIYHHPQEVQDGFAAVLTEW